MSLHWGVQAAFSQTHGIDDAPAPLLRQEAEFNRRIAALVEQLGNPNFRLRQDAQWELRKFGLLAFELLRETALEHENIQIANSAKYILQSQETQWWTETDSAEVKSYLRDYSSASAVRKHDSILLLGTLASQDAWLALCRLARYEQSEDISKSASLALMESLLDQDQIPMEVYASLQVAIGQGFRPAVAWLREFSKRSLDASKFSLEESSLAWKKFVETECAEPSPLNEQRERQVRFCQAVAEILEDLKPNQRTEIISPSLLNVAGTNPYDLLGVAEWAIDARLPELVLSLAALREDQFSSNGEVAYAHAEAHLKIGNQIKARELAERASTYISLNDATKKLTNKHKVVDVVARNRYRIAKRLDTRGLYEWAEIEFQKSLDESSSKHNTPIRKAFSEFYYAQEDFEKAALVLEPLAEDMAKSMAEGRSVRGMQSQERIEVLSSHGLYSALAEQAEGRIADARNSIRSAYETNPNKPEIVKLLLNLAEVDAPEEYVKFTERCFATTVENYRMRIVASENELSIVGGRNDRRRKSERLAQECTRLAWLLASVERNLTEASQLASRAIELKPGSPNYMHTLALSRFASGRVEEAVEIQAKVVALRPFDRQMSKQLERFVAGL